MKKARSRLRVLRAEQEVTQSQLAKRVAAHLPNGRTFSSQRYWQIENGEGKEPDDDERAAVAAALGVKVSDIAWPSTDVRQSA